jgi:hypothetical protein
LFPHGSRENYQLNICMSFMAEGNDGIRPNQVFIMDHGTINTSLGTRLCIVFKYAIGLWNATVGQIY